ncbi:MAG: tRNA (cytidine(34)-2'-O)-methyltransferase [Rhodocyclaceae bacterium]|jgi:tRNA (cytidine/uridine-2'-O-)-methyltransferase|nr:tRNA (cytidine(34)-2'-O)-methyltransferase [Rhodocyclaceae bacterium]MBP7080059.1 tRNA (cytidine(34)-2'-O)-methyltransferase [Rhodocyclaceae bacterium]
MFHVVLINPEIPPNTGNIIRLCANTGATLHLVHPLGFDLSEPQLRRAGMDYAELTVVQQHDNWEACRDVLGDARRYALTTKGVRRVTSTNWQAGDAMIFGCETRGLPSEVLADIAAENRLRLPMMDVPKNRSLNLSNAVAVVVYEGWRQLGFPGST